MKKYKIIFDLDGILRDLIGAFCKDLNLPIPTKWEFKKGDKTIYEWMEEKDYEPLVTSFPTEYYRTIRNNTKDMEIWTDQIPEWRPYTEEWIRIHLGKCKIRYLLTSEKESRLYGLKNTYLVEDCPNFKDYSNIILIDRPYNQNVKAPNRMKTPSELETILTSLL